MQTVLSIVAVVLSAVSITWQAATFVLTGGRVKARLRVGAMHASGRGMTTSLVSDVRRDWETQFARLADQGFTRPVIAVEVTNVGRMPVTVSKWSIKAAPGGMGYVPLETSIGPELPYRLDAGTSETWAVDLNIAHGLAAASTVIADVEAYSVTGVVSLGDGRSYTTPDVLRVQRPDIGR